ncbi:MAG: hypothetical protein CMF39_00580 [Legionellaceae bacterium]|nr:hypothetical protein [Legionellaceae bacterium]
MTSLKKILLASSLSVTAIAMSSAYAHTGSNMQQLLGPSNINQPVSPFQTIIAHMSPRQRQAFYHELGAAVRQGAQVTAHGSQAVLGHYGAAANVRITGPTGRVIADTATPVNCGSICASNA